MSSEIVDIQTWVLNYINEYCIYRVAPGDDPLPGKAPGTTYTWQFYLRRGLTNPRFCRAIGILFWYRMKHLYDQTPFQITGLETGATPLVIALAMTGPPDFNAFITRQERKTYGLNNQFEGIIDYRLPVMLVDDLTNSKNTMVQAMQHVQDEGLSLYRYGFSIINKDVDGIHTDHDKYIGEHFKIFSLFQYSDFVLDWAMYQQYVEKHKIIAKPWLIERNSLLNTMSDFKDIK